MKGLSQTLYLVVVAVVILIVALVLLTIFSVGLGGVVELSKAQGFCGTEGATSCKATGGLPVDWIVPKYNVEGTGLVPCATILCEDGTDTCETCGFPTQ
ncbi:MAG: hypothetical protein KKB03_04120 [Nanoarchaeota archaeon]|nr:hypothetical protein [Nanoarchaeota archaeon]MBU1135804.1 hypothetical protein [Nanoarchaeota archaeon]MBU2520400.1 hypothetical protein [Nanoarchaeota archaeon]